MIHTDLQKSLSESEERSLFINFLMQDLGLGSLEVSRVLIILSPLLKEFIDVTIHNTLSEEEIQALMYVAKEENLDEVEKAELVSLGFQDKHEEKKTIKDVVRDFYNGLYQALVKAIQDMEEKTIALVHMAKEKKEEFIHNLIREESKNLLNL